MRHARQGENCETRGAHLVEEQVAGERPQPEEGWRWMAERGDPEEQVMASRLNLIRLKSVVY